MTNIFIAGIKEKINSIRHGKWWKRIALGLIIVAWFFRDFTATSFEQRTHEVEKVLTEKDNELQHQEQEQDQREVQRMLAKIELRQVSSSEPSQDAIDTEYYRIWAKTARDEGKALEKRAKTFTNLLAHLSLTDKETNQSLVEITEPILKTAQDLRNAGDGVTSEDPKALADQFTKADETLQQGYDNMAREGEKELAGNSELATGCRAVAWIFTALGALMTGNFKKLLGDSDSEEDNADQAAEEATEG